MASEERGLRSLKRKVLELLKQDDFDKSLHELCLLPGRQVINPLFSYLLHGEEHIRWRAVAAMGAVVANLAQEDMESARVIMRRLMWSLNEESGGIGWGAAEAMAEIMARHEGLAGEYAYMLASYMDYEGNFLEYEALQRGVLWAVVRLAQARPEMLVNTVPHLAKYIQSADGITRGLAVLAAGLLGAEQYRPAIRELLYDDSEVEIYFDNKSTHLQVKDLANQALALLDQSEAYGNE